MKSKKRKKLDILYRKSRKWKDPHSTYEILMDIKTKDKIRMLEGKKKRFPSLRAFDK
ncbi:hypothetical protein ACQKGD_15150 [Peribacillus frigoritolerans]|uniref:hypothetical protein n=1 Tax=Peribacillus frigoritolerans TaxID=450367 RepID=UPI003CFC2EE1